MGDLDGRTFLITGANTGIGRATAGGLAARGAIVFIAGRSRERTERAVAEISRQTGNDSLRPLQLDLGDLDSVRACAEQFLTTGAPLHCLINNAGLAGKRGMTPSGFELAFGTNHVGPFLLTRLLVDRLTDSAPARVVNVASAAHLRATGIDFEAVRTRTRTRSGLHEYGVSKLANVLHAIELGRRLDGAGVTTYSLHPGVIASDVWRQIPWPVRPLIKLRMGSTEDGARTPLYCATSADAGRETGLYYDGCRARPAGPAATPELARDLWDRSEEWTAG